MDKKGLEIIHLSLPFRMGNVNCYLLKTGSGFILIDTGGSKNRRELVSTLENARCEPGILALILLTHGDFDHTGNAATLRWVFGSKIAMHREDAGMVERGDMFVNRNQPNGFIRSLMPVLSGFGRAERFTPDLYLGDGDDLSEFGWNARIISLPGHSKGSIGILTGSGDFFCGDLLENTKKPGLNSLIDDREAAKESIRKMESMEIKMIYPGHGHPFSIGQLRLESQ